MTDGVDPSQLGVSSGLPAEDGDQCSVEAYETDDGTVFYDAWNPLAWIESSVTVSIDEAV